MFNKISRYYKLDDVVTRDSDGFKLASKAIRLIDKVDAQVEHVIDSQDRLDHLGYKYYKQSKQWWRICDANRDEASPLDLLGKANKAEVVLSLRYLGYQPDWYLLTNIQQLYPGIIELLLGYGDDLEPQRDVAQGVIRFDLPISLQTDLDAMVRSQTPLPSIATEFVTNAMPLSADLKISKLGGGLWQIEDFANQFITQLRQAANPPGDDIINVYASEVVFSWTAWIHYNTDLISQETIAQYIEALPGFDITGTDSLSKVGKKIFIPNKFIG